MTDAETALDAATLALSSAINAWGKALLAHQAEVLARVTAASPAPAMPAAAPAPSVMAGLDPATHPAPVDAPRSISNGGGTVDSAVPTPQRRGLLQRTPARRLRLQALLAEEPRRPLREIVAALNDVRPGTDITGANVAAWIHELTRGLASGRRRAEEGGDAPTPVPSPAPAVPAPPPPAPHPLVQAMADVVQVGPREYARRQAAPAPSPAPQSNYPKNSGSSVVAAAPRIAAIPPPTRPVPAFRTDPIVADDSYIRSWAAQRGMPQGGTIDLAAINEKAVALGLRPFANPADRKPFRLGATA